MEQVKFHTIPTHVRAHWDEHVGIWLFWKFGEKMFPGISEAKVIYWGSGGTPDGRSAEEYEKEGVLPIGVGGGRFDEHPTPTKKRNAGECAATLVAKALGVHDLPELRQILIEAVTNDLNGGGSSFGVPAIIQLLHQQYPDNPEKVMDWAMMALDAKYREQVEFFHDTKREFEQKAKVEVIGWFCARFGEKKPLKLVTIVSDNEQIAKYARSEYGGYAAVVVQKKSSGNVMIFTNKYYKPDVSNVAGQLRIAENAKSRRNSFPPLCDHNLLLEGKVVGAEEWFYQKSGETLLNGSSTAPDVSPTKIPFEEIVAIVKKNARFG